MFNLNKTLQDDMKTHFPYELHLRIKDVLLVLVNLKLL